jgi:hypothetical protein
VRIFSESLATENPAVKIMLNDAANQTTPQTAEQASQTSASTAAATESKF